jgi:heavy metal sensor kinase
MFTSIKAKIILFYMAVLFVILSVLGVFLYFSLSKIIYNSIDSSLLSKAKALTTLISRDEEDKTEFRFSDEIMWEYSSPRPRSFFQIRRLGGFTLEKSESLKDSELPYSGKETRTDFKTITVRGHLSRLVNFYVHAELRNSVKGGGQDIIIQCAEDIGDQLELLEDFGTVLLGAVLSVLLVSALGGFIIAKKALNPVQDISRAIDRISEQDLSKRISIQGVPHELVVLATSFNRTFERLEKAFNRQDQFAADASHELRTPLSVILSQSEIALRKERTAEEYKGSLNAIMNAARTMSATVRKLLTLTRLRADKVELKFESIEINELISESATLLSPLAEQKGIHIETSQISEQSIVRGDRAALLELFTNLLDNAIKYNVPQGKVHVCIREEKEFIVCEIKDTGIGIPSDALDKVFDRFYRVDHSRSKEIDGSGLGLSICREIARLHGGKIDIKSIEGEGTILSVYLKGTDRQQPDGLINA